MTNNFLPSSKDRERLDRILRRIDFLENRVKNPIKDLWHDKAECSSLRWAVRIILERYPELMLDKNYEKENEHIKKYLDEPLFSTLEHEQQT